MGTDVNIHGYISKVQSESFHWSLYCVFFPPTIVRLGPSEMVEGVQRERQRIGGLLPLLTLTSPFPVQS